MENKEDKGLFRKPSIRKKQPLPPVRETLTSRIRLLKADPLLAKELGIQDLNKLSTIKSSKDGNLLDHKLKSYINQFGDKKTTTPVQHRNNDSRQQESASSRKLQSSHGEKSMVVNDNKNDKKLNVDKDKKNISSSSTSMFHHSQQFLSSTRLVPDTKAKKIDYIKQNIEQASKKTKIKNLQQQQKNPPKNPTMKIDKRQPIRRSLSAQHFDRKNGKRINDKPEECFKRIDKAQSFEEIRNMVKKTMVVPPQISPVVEENNLTFKTPSAYQRRSVINNKTPATTNIKNNRNTTLFGFTSTPAPYNLQKRLVEWLEKRGRTINDFQHLKCFGIDQDLQQNDDENKENIEIVINDNTVGVDENLENIAKEILIDLQNLLTEGYPVEQCEIWLCSIEQKYNKLHKEPDYWELRALIEQSRGNITTAVECYQNAIIQGAEIRSVDESLENLLQKFSLLNITPTKQQINSSNNERQRIIKDARNVFKSSIIQFAVKERTLKNRNNDNNNNIDNVDKKFVITPVRRSTRLSRATKYTSTPGTKYYSSLKDVESPIRRNLDFQDNPAL